MQWLIKTKRSFSKMTGFNSFIGKTIEKQVRDSAWGRLDLQKGDYGRKQCIARRNSRNFALKDRTLTSTPVKTLCVFQNWWIQTGIILILQVQLGGTFEAKQYNIEYSERSLTELMLSGSIFLAGGKWNVNWKVSFQNYLLKWGSRYPIYKDFQVTSEYWSQLRWDFPERIWRTIRWTKCSC